ncbi:hypothetical protein F2Q69_00011079 [Brassica cretica]|uniref:Uncharacterized protein n=1 Tax=Brassica cretica TaxID=69181 RepID=A0A8S9R1T8_BRACR|nr:hypothetical protein F2Q69_00011079 [Brassica cretica]
MKIIVAGLQYSASQSVAHPAFGPIPHSPISRGPFFYRPTKNCPNSVLQQTFTGQTRGPAPASPFLYGTNIRRYQTELTFPRSSSKGPTMAVSLSSSSTITPITLQPKLKPIHAIGTVNFGYSFNSHGVSLRRSAVVASAITGASGTETADLLETVKVSDLRGNEIPISDLWKDRKAVVAFARHFGYSCLSSSCYTHVIREVASKESQLCIQEFVCWEPFQDKEAGDDPPVEEILKACCA